MMNLFMMMFIIFLDNIQFLTHSKREYVLLAPSYMICNIDYNEVLEYHKEQEMILLWYIKR